MSLAPWPLIDDIKQALKLLQTDASNDGEIAAWVAVADSWIQSYCGVPVVPQAYTDIDRTTDDQPTATFAPPTVLMLNHMPVDLTQEITVTAYDGSVVDTIGPNPSGPPYYSANENFYIDPLKGIIYAYQPGDITFGQGPYTITYAAGLTAHPDWGAKYRALAGRVVRDLCAWMSEHVNVAAKVESAGGGVSTSWFDGVPPRICVMTRMLPNGTSGVAGGIGV
jgi:hypothetical protein